MNFTEACKEHTTFVTRFGNFSFDVKPFEIINVPATFQKMMDEVLKDVSFARAYSDDMIIHSDTIEEHVENISVVFGLLQKLQRKLHVYKSTFGTDSVKRNGNIDSADGVKTYPKKIEAVRDDHVPHDRTYPRRLLGIDGN